MHVFSAITAQTPFFSSANFMGKLCYRFIAIIKKVQINPNQCFLITSKHPKITPSRDFMNTKPLGHLRLWEFTIETITKPTSTPPLKKDGET
jgi:hypothetical protein